MNSCCLLSNYAITQLQEHSACWVRQLLCTSNTEYASTRFLCINFDEVCPLSEKQKFLPSSILLYSHPPILPYSILSNSHAPYSCPLPYHHSNVHGVHFMLWVAAHTGMTPMAKDKEGTNVSWPGGPRWIQVDTNREVFNWHRWDTFFIHLLSAQLLWSQNYNFFWQIVSRSIRLRDYSILTSKYWPVEIQGQIWINYKYTQPHSGTTCIRVESCGFPSSKQIQTWQTGANLASSIICCRGGASLFRVKGGRSDCYKSRPVFVFTCKRPENCVFEPRPLSVIFNSKLTW